MIYSQQTSSPSLHVISGSCPFSETEVNDSPRVSRKVDGFAGKAHQNVNTVNYDAQESQDDGTSGGIRVNEFIAAEGVTVSR